MWDRAGFASVPFRRAATLAGVPHDTVGEEDLFYRWFAPSRGLQVGRNGTHRAPFFPHGAFHSMV